MRPGHAIARRRILLVLLSLPLAGPAGCGPQIPKTYPVKGKVVVTGGKLSKGSTIMFQLVSDTQVVADGVIQDDGTFMVTTKMYGKSRAGAVEGEHNVLISEPDTRGPNGLPAYRPIIASKKARVEPHDNDLVIEAHKAGRP
jgi:hypothetical protein